MKKLILLLLVAFLGLTATAQRGTTKAITVDTVKGNEDVYFVTEKFTGGYDVLTMQMLATRVSTAAGGTAYLQGSVDGTSYTTLTARPGCIDCWIDGTTNDTVCGKAFADAASAVFQVKIKDTPWKYYRWWIDGDVNDTMIISAKYIFK